MDSDDVEIVPQIIKHKSLYFQDGNIILSVPHDNADEVHLFKCHKSVLAKHSPVFAEMFELAQDGRIEADEHDGLPCVTLPDSWKDVESLLNLLYDPLKMPYKKHKTSTATVLHGPLRLATKYQMDSLRNRFASILQRDWPSSLQGWDDNEAEIAKESQKLLARGRPGEDAPFPEPAKVIRLASECNITSILPAALYHMGRCYDMDKCGEEAKYYPPDTELLTTSDWSTLLRGRDHMRSEVTRFFHTFIIQRRKLGGCYNSPEDEPESWGCRRQVKDWWTTTCFEMLSGPDDILFVDPLEGLKRLSNMAVLNPQICKRCREWMQREILGERHRVWGDLQGYYGLDLGDNMQTSSSDA